MREYERDKETSNRGPSPLCFTGQPTSLCMICQRHTKSLPALRTVLVPLPVIDLQHFLLSRLAVGMDRLPVKLEVPRLEDDGSVGFA